jgi:hypothetical protein
MVLWTDSASEKHSIRLGVLGSLIVIGLVDCNVNSQLELLEEHVGFRRFLSPVSPDLKAYLFTRIALIFRGRHLVVQ